jgi:succinyl-CoA synthetase beta subunit
MKIHEYQAKEILRGYGVAVPPGCAVLRRQDIAAAVAGLETDVWVVKAQIHAGGRGKGGGVKLARTVVEAEALAEQILGMNLVTHQTGSQGKEVKRLLVEAGAAIEKEFYLGMVLDRDTASVVIISSTEGGTEIEHVAATTPERIHTVHVDPVLGIQPYQARLVAFSLGLTGKPALKAATIVERLYRLFVEKDCSLAEVNPLILTTAGDVLALDAKINFDANALYRHPELLALRDLDEEDPAEVEASRHDLNYIKLDGDIGCMVNGAGLAMATMDIIQAFGGQPANFLDVGGGTTKERVAAAFRVLLQDRPRAIFVNIFGGIVRCDVIAGGIVAALQEMALTAPLVVRLEGTNRAEGQQILAESGLPIISAENMEDGARKAVQAARG